MDNNCTTQVLLSLIAGCASRATTWEAYTVSSVPSSTFDSQWLTQEKVAVLSTTTADDFLGYSSVLSLGIDQGLAKPSSPINAISTTETLNILNRKGEGESYLLLIEDWKNGGLLELSRIRMIGEALEVKFILLPGMINISSVMYDRFTMQGFQILQTRTVSISWWIKIWNAETGELLWKSFGSGTMQKEVFIIERGLMDVLSKNVWEGMIEDLKLGNTTLIRSGSLD